MAQSAGEQALPALQEYLPTAIYTDGGGGGGKDKGSKDKGSKEKGKQGKDRGKAAKATELKDWKCGNTPARHSTLPAAAAATTRAATKFSPRSSTRAPAAAGRS